MNPNNKKYGLLVPKKELSAPKAGNVFGDDDSDEDTGGVNWVEKTIKAEAEKHRLKKQTKLNVQRALEVDPTIFQYDEIYDDMEKSRSEKEVSAAKEAKKPKYVHNIVKAAERRKLENERRIERMVQKERDAEGDMYKDKEVFVTATHRANLERMRKMDEEEERMNRLEAIADVTKQPDMSGFYRYLYSQTIDKKPAKEENVDEAGASTAESVENIDQDEDLSVDSDSSEHSQSGSEAGSEDADENKVETKKKFTSRRRQYRSRKVEDSEESEDEDETKAKVIKTEEKEIEAEDKAEEKEDESAEKIEDSVEEKEKDDSKKGEVDVSKVKDEKEKIVEVPQEEKPKVSIWEKRTVGEVFDGALQRYYVRKALRMSS